jgi:hypothetical protein
MENTNTAQEWLPADEVNALVRGYFNSDRLYAIVREQLGWSVRKANRATVTDFYVAIKRAYKALDSRRDRHMFQAHFTLAGMTLENGLLHAIETGRLGYGAERTINEIRGKQVARLIASIAGLSGDDVARSLNQRIAA